MFTCSCFARFQLSTAGFTVYPTSGVPGARAPSQPPKMELKIRSGPGPASRVEGTNGLVWRLRLESPHAAVREPVWSGLVVREDRKSWDRWLGGWPNELFNEDLTATTRHGERPAALAILAEFRGSQIYS